MGLRIGLSCEELRRIGYAEISWLLHRWVEMNSVERESDVRDANASDVKKLMMM